MSTASMAATLDDVVRGRLKVLFVSPERLTSSAFRRMFIPRWNPETKMKERSFPTVALLCVDEAHCMSTWGANFRPSYLRMRAMTELIQPQSVLAITATAGPRVVGDICRSLGINGSADSPPESLAKDTQQCDGGVRVMKSDRDNIDVSCMILSNQVERLSKVRERKRGCIPSFRFRACLLTQLLNPFAADESVDEGERKDQRRTGG